MIKEEKKLRLQKALSKQTAENEICSHAIIKLLLNQKGEEIRITESVVHAASQNRHHKDDIMKMLLDGRAQIEITEGMKETVKKKFGQELNALFAARLERRTSD